jgi:hypothetical protein
VTAVKDAILQDSEARFGTASVGSTRQPCCKDKNPKLVEVVEVVVLRGVEYTEAVPAPAPPAAGTVALGSARIAPTVPRPVTSPATTVREPASAPTSVGSTGTAHRDPTVRQELRVHPMRAAAPEPGPGRKQYINLDEKTDPDEPHKEYGRALRFRARVAWDGDAAGCPLAGRHVYWYAVPDPANRAKLWSPPEYEGFATVGSRERRFVSEVDEQGWTPIVTFYLPQYGGDRFEIFATIDERFEGGTSAGAFVVWRRLWFDLVEMKRSNGLDVARFEMPPACLDAYRSAYAYVYIELVDTLVRHIGEHRHRLAGPPPISPIEGMFLYALGRLPRGPDDEWADHYYSAVRAPQKIHLCVVDDSVPPAVETPADDKATSDLFQFAKPIVPDEGGDAPWLVKAELPDAAGTPIPVDRVTLVGALRARHIQVDLRGLGLDPSPASPVPVRITYRQGDLRIGYSQFQAHHQFILRGRIEELLPDEDPTAEISTTLIHESGHWMSLVTDENVPWQDHDNPGHCNRRNCIMYFETTGEQLSFHDDGAPLDGCRTYLRWMDLSREAIVKRPTRPDPDHPDPPRAPSDPKAKLVPAHPLGQE